MADRLTARSRGANSGGATSRLKTYGSKKSGQTRRRSSPFFQPSSPLTEKSDYGHDNIEGPSSSPPPKLITPPSSSPLKRTAQTQTQPQKSASSSHVLSWDTSSDEDSQETQLNSSPPGRITLKRDYDETWSSETEAPDGVEEETEEEKPSIPRLSHIMPSILNNMKKRRTTPYITTHIPAAPKMVQARLALMDDMKTTCKDCGMSYMPTYSMDVKLHAKFHSQSFDGRDWAPEWGTPVTMPDLKSSRAISSTAPTTRASTTARAAAPALSTTKSASSASSLHSYTFDPDSCIVKITPSSKIAEKRAAQDLINLVNTELSAPPENPTWNSGPAGAGSAYIFISSKTRKAVAVLVVERVTRGRPMLAATSELLPDEEAETVSALAMESASESASESALGLVKKPDLDSETATTTTTTTTTQANTNNHRPSELLLTRFPVIMGVARIFTVKNYRRQGIGSVLLDAACKDFIYGLEIRKSQVAWSQPSASGAKLALAWTPSGVPSGVTGGVTGGVSCGETCDVTTCGVPSDDYSKASSGLKSSNRIIVTYLEQDAVVRG